MHSNKITKKVVLFASSAMVLGLAAGIAIHEQKLGLHRDPAKVLVAEGTYRKDVRIKRAAVEGMSSLAYLQSSDNQYTLLATAFNDTVLTEANTAAQTYSEPAKIGYSVNGADHEADTYYGGITLNIAGTPTTFYAEDIFGDSHEGDHLIVYEAEGLDLRTQYAVCAYVKVGTHYSKDIDVDVHIEHKWGATPISHTDKDCVTDGEDVYQCEYCEETKTVKDTHTGHNYEIVTGAAATHVDAGWNDYYECKNENCHAYAEDENGDTPIADLAAWKTGKGAIAALGHTFVKQDGKDADCTNDGWNDYYKCSCDALAEDENGDTPITDLEAWKTGKGKIGKIGHDYQPVSAKAHSCTEDGYKAYYECQNCHSYAEDANGDTPIADLANWKANSGKDASQGHDYGTFVPEVAPNRGTDGMKAHYYCDDCKTYFDSSKNATTAEDLKIKNRLCTINGGNKAETFDLKAELTETVVLDVKVDDSSKGMWICFYCSCDEWNRTACARIYGSTWEYATNVDGATTFGGVAYLGATSDGYHRYRFILSKMSKEAKVQDIDVLAVYKWDHSSGKIDINPNTSIKTSDLTIAEGDFKKGETFDLKNSYFSGDGKFVVDMYFSENSNENSQIMFGNWSKWAGYFKILSNGSCSGIFNGMGGCSVSDVTVELIEDKHVRVTYDLSKYDYEYKLIYFNNNYGNATGTFTAVFRSSY